MGPSARARAGGTAKLRGGGQRDHGASEFDRCVGIHKTNWIWTKGHAAHEDNNRCDWLAQNAARTQASSWPDGTPHGRLRLDLGRDYVPPKPQAGLFDTLDPGDNDEDESDPG